MTTPYKVNVVDVATSTTFTLYIFTLLLFTALEV